MLNLFIVLWLLTGFVCWIIAYNKYYSKIYYSNRVTKMFLLPCSFLIDTIGGPLCIVAYICYSKHLER